MNRKRLPSAESTGSCTSQRPEVRARGRPSPARYRWAWPVSSLTNHRLRASGIQSNWLKLQLIQPSGSLRRWRVSRRAVAGSSVTSQRSLLSTECSISAARVPSAFQRITFAPKLSIRTGRASFSGSLPAALRSPASGSSEMPGSRPVSSFCGLPFCMSTSQKVIGSGSLRPTRVRTSSVSS